MDIQPVGNALAQSYEFANQTIAATGPPLMTATTAANPVPDRTPSALPSPAQLTQAVDSINQTMQKLAPGLEFSIDKESNHAIVKVVDQQTKELIRQMPSAETIEIAKALDRVQGLLISLRA